MLDEEKSILSKGTDTLKNAMTNVSDVFNDDFGRPKPSIIVSFLLLLLVIYGIMYYYRQTKYSPYLLLDVTPTSELQIPSKKIPDSIYSNEYSYSMWIYVSSDALDNTIADSGNKNIIISRKGTDDTYKMVYALDVKKHKLLIRYKLLNGSNCDLLEDNAIPCMIKCDIENIQYDTFVHLAVVVYGNSIVVYINGILVKTVVYQGKLEILKNNDTILNQYQFSNNNNNIKGYPGWISKLRYFVDLSKENGGALNDKQVYDLYLNSPYPSLFTRVVHSIADKFVSHSSDGDNESIYSDVNIDSLNKVISAPTNKPKFTNDKWNSFSKEFLVDVKNLLKKDYDTAYNES